MFHNEEDYLVFERVLAEAVERTKTRLLAHCVMPNHWRLVVGPREDGELSRRLLLLAAAPLRVSQAPAQRLPLAHSH